MRTDTVKKPAGNTGISTITVDEQREKLKYTPSSIRFPNKAFVSF